MHLACRCGPLLSCQAKDNVVIGQHLQNRKLRGHVVLQYQVDDLFPLLDAGVKLAGMFLSHLLIRDQLIAEKLSFPHPGGSKISIRVVAVGHMARNLVALARLDVVMMFERVKKLSGTRQNWFSM